MDCFCHFSRLAQPCFQPCSPQKPMVERQLHSEGIKRSVCAAFHLKALRIHLVTWKNPFYLAPSSAPLSVCAHCSLTRLCLVEKLLLVRHWSLQTVPWEEVTRAHSSSVTTEGSRQLPPGVGSTRGDQSHPRYTSWCLASSKY